MSRIHRATDSERLPREAVGGLDEEFLECGLAVFGERAEIGEIGTEALEGSDGEVGVRVDAAVERNTCARSKSRVEIVERAPSDIAENQVIVAKAARPYVSDPQAVFEPLQRDTGVKIVESM